MEKDIVYGYMENARPQHKEKQVFEEIEKMKMDVYVLATVENKGKGNEQFGKYTHLYSGVSKSQRTSRGISIVIDQKTIKECDETDESHHN